MVRYIAAILDYIAADILKVIIVIIAPRYTRTIDTMSRMYSIR